MRRMSGWMMSLVCGAAVAALAGCKPSEAIKEGVMVGKGVNPAVSPLDPATLGSVSGTVRFAGKPPERVKIDMSMDPACSLATDNYTEQYVVHDGKLANVYLYIKSGPAVAMTAPSTVTAPVVMDQSGCKYVPHVVAVMKNSTVEFRNSDSTMHNIHTLPAGGGRQVDVSQGPRGAPSTVEFKQPEIMMPVRCNNHPWMNAFINVADTPFFAVSDAKGHFEVVGLPAGTYVLAAVHEKMGEQTMTVTVKPHETAGTDFSFATK